MPCAEVTLRTDSALEIIALIARQAPKILIGAGTVLNVEQAQQVADAEPSPSGSAP